MIHSYKLTDLLLIDVAKNKLFKPNIMHFRVNNQAVLNNTSARPIVGPFKFVCITLLWTYLSFA